MLVPALDEAVSEVGRAITDLRTIAAGLRPSSLDDGLARRPRRARAPTRSRSTSRRRRRAARGRGGRLLRRLRGGHQRGQARAAPSSIVDAARRRRRDPPAVADDGVGGAAPRPGSGLAGLADRLAAHGGTWPSRARRHGHARRGGDPVRVVIAEDTALLREGLAGLLTDSGHEVSARSATPRRCSPRSRSTSRTSP